MYFLLMLQYILQGRDSQIEYDISIVVCISSIAYIKPVIFDAIHLWFRLLSIPKCQICFISKLI
jgi:hypothetical protein